MNEDARTPVLSFGPFRLFPAQELLLRADQPVQIGSRALALLAVLAERAEDVVGKRELFDLVWPNTAIEESSLRVHLAALREIFGDGDEGMRYIATIPGRGYRFVAPTVRLNHPPPGGDNGPADSLDSEVSAQ